MEIQWYPGHMAKSMRSLKERIRLTDVVAEVLDARAPGSTLNPDLDELFAKRPRLLVLNKADLADPEITSQWVAYYRNRGQAALAFSVPVDAPDILKKAIGEAARDTVEKYRQKGMRKTVRVMVAGVPNVGKSAIINRMAGKSRLKEENKPGITRGLQWVRIGPHLELMDTPGVLWPKFEDQHTAAKVAFIGSIKAEIMDAEELAMILLEILRDMAPELLRGRYGVDGTGGNGVNIMENIAKKRGFLLKKGEYDFERTAKTVLSEFRSGTIGRFSLEKPGELS